jgi:hypothetical protein
MGFEQFSGHHEAVLPPPGDFKFASKAHELKSGAAYASTHGGLLPSDLFWHYMQYRYDLANYEGLGAQFATLIRK